MSRGNKSFLASAGLALAVAFIWASPALAQLTTSDPAAGSDDLAPAAVTELTVVADLIGPSVELSWVQSASDFVRQSPTGLDLTSGGTFVNVNDVSAYDIWRDNGAGLQLIDSADAGEDSYVDDSVLSGVIYTYAVTAVDAAGNESEAVVSDPISLKPADPGTGVPDAPEQVEIVTQVTVTFDIEFSVDACADAIAKMEEAFPQFAGQLSCEEGSLIITFPEIVEDPNEPTLIEQIEEELADPESPLAPLGPAALTGFKAADLDFGDVARDESITENFAFSNSSNDPEAILVVNVSVDGDGYSLSTGTLSVAPGESGSFDISFSAADVANANGSYPGTMTIRTNDPENQLTDIALTAVITTGLDPGGFNLSDDEIAFGVQELGVGATDSFTITNTGGLDLVVTLALAGDDAFAISSTGETLGEGESVDIEVVFTPTASIDYSGTITIATNDVDNPEATVTLSGTGAPPTVPRLELSDDAIDFGAITVGDDADETLTISNTGGADLTSSIALAGDAAFSLEIDGVAVAAGDSLDLADLAPGGSVDITVEFAAGDTVDYTGTITVTSNDADALEVTVALSGSGQVGPVCKTALNADGDTLVGFLDDDDDVDLFDFFLFADAFGTEEGETGHDPCADFNEDDTINLFDFFLFADSFGGIPDSFN